MLYMYINSQIIISEDFLRTDLISNIPRNCNFSIYQSTLPQKEITIERECDRNDTLDIPLNRNTWHTVEGSFESRRVQRRTEHRFLIKECGEASIYEKISCSSGCFLNERPEPTRPFKSLCRTVKDQMAARYVGCRLARTFIKT